eukprot:CAMPEP_0194285680 /NCGR_PEP_ID=MMETSP0169-20130528/30752_1 /TAXON_ID=218684 /ORGANISM="Corethron pennatum, Strain L29A3" /LENGTH=79 /DNA_ID=CAMNT_0039031863 /DNA_START=358 /DNA_END=594 /DNA_ORIENTATION=+
MIGLVVLSSIFAAPLAAPGLSYSAMCGLAAESVAHRRSRDAHLLAMVRAVGRSSAARSAGAADGDLALELEERSAELAA